MKKLLIVAYFFPPFREVGAFRIRKLVKYFSRFGWDITVVTVDEKYYEQNSIDYGMLNDIPDNVEIIKTKRIKEFTKFKEQGAYWIGNLFKTQYKLLRNNKYDYVFYTGGPFIHFIIAPLMKKMFNAKYVLDFRDPWLLTPYNHSKFRKIIASILEPICIKHSEYIINVTNDATNMYKAYYKKVPNYKFLTVENGFDSEDFFQISDSKERFPNSIVYAGKFGGFRNINNFLEALKFYNENNNKKITFIHIGMKEEAIIKFLENNTEMEKYIICLGYKTYNEAMKIINGCEYGLIISGGHPYEPTTKVYDYIALKKPILCINDIKIGYLYELINKYNNGYLSKNKTEDILNQLKKMFHAENISKSCDINIDEFDRKNIFFKLNLILMKQRCD